VQGARSDGLSEDAEGAGVEIDCAAGGRIPHQQTLLYMPKGVPAAGGPPRFGDHDENGGTGDRQDQAAETPLGEAIIWLWRGVLVV